VNLWANTIPGFGTLGLLVILFALVLATLYLKGLLHAAAVAVIGRARPILTPRGVTLQVTSPDWYFPKFTMALVAVAPFFTVSIVGTVLLAVVPSTALAWVYLPIVVNSVATGRDVITLSWLFVTPKGALLVDSGEVLTAYAPPGAKPRKESRA
jgi:hypothetical protein